jgi:hypothetical protein
MLHSKPFALPFAHQHVDVAASARGGGARDKMPHQLIAPGVGQLS